MTEAMPFLQKYDITFLRPPTITAGAFSVTASLFPMLQVRHHGLHVGADLLRRLIL